MPRYYFHISDGTDFVDESGLDLIDIEAAKREALRLAGAVLSDEQPASIWSDIPWTMKVSENPKRDQGSILFGLTVSASGGE